VIVANPARNPALTGMHAQAFRIGKALRDGAGLISVCGAFDPAAVPASRPDPHFPGWVGSSVGRAVPF
jgi:hypothetical protein